MADSDAAVTIDWDGQAFWVQDTQMYLVQDDGSAAEVQVMAQDGTRKLMNRDDLAESHFLFQKGAIYKPHFRPVQALCLEEDTLITLETGQTALVPAGDAVLRLRDGRITVLDRHSFNCHYRIVDTGGPVAPTIAYQSSAG